MYIYIYTYRDGFVCSFMRIQNVNLTIVNITLQNMTLYSNFSMITVETANASSMSNVSVSYITLINNTQILFAKTTLAFFQFDRGTITLKIKNCYFKNIIANLDAIHQDSGIIYISQNSYLVYMKNIVGNFLTVRSINI